MIARLRSFLVQREFVLLLGLISGFVIGDLAVWTKSLVLPVLGLALTVSTIDIPNSFFYSPRQLLKGILYGTLLSYVVLGLPYMAASLFFPMGSSLQNGLLLIAVAPPAVAVLPFTVLLEGDQAFSLASCIGGYLGALLFFPLLSFYLWQDVQVPQNSLIFSLVLLIILPLAVSRLIRRSIFVDSIRAYRGTLVNWCFFVVITTIVGINRDYLCAHLEIVPWLALIAILLTFGLGALLGSIGKRRFSSRERTTSIVLLSTLKNYGIASGLAIQFFPPETALPPVVGNVVMIIYFIWLSLSFRRKS
ncbi:MAG: bile acid:sodium symporter family protein [Thermodesulfobacteriota bacterium]